MNTSDGLAPEIAAIVQRSTAQADAERAKIAAFLDEARGAVEVADRAALNALSTRAAALEDLARAHVIGAADAWALCGRSAMTGDILAEAVERLDALRQVSRAIWARIERDSQAGEIRDGRLVAGGAQ